MAVHQDLRVGALAERGGAHPQLGPEPASSLVVGLEDEVGGPELVEPAVVRGVVQRPHDATEESSQTSNTSGTRV